MKSHLRTLFTTALLSAAVVGQAFAGPIDLNKARQLAQKYISQPTEAHSAAAKKAQKRGKSASAQPAYYLFNNADGKGFAIIPSDDRLGTVIGYSQKGQLNDSLPVPLQNLLADYAAAAERIQVDSVTMKPSYPNRPKTSVAPLIGSKWDQGYPWNKYCPTRQGIQTYVGCVAAAMSQVLFYHKWPKERPEGAIKGTDDAQALSYYDWDNILPVYTGVSYTSHQASAVATLCRDVGGAADMTYGIDGSWSDESKAWRAFENKFGYSVRFIEKDVMPGNEYLETVYNELSAGYPIFLTGGDHAFVYEGYDANGLVYCNWGWQGQGDGYYDINTVSISGNPYTQGKFYHMQTALLVRPKDGKHQLFTEQPIVLSSEKAGQFYVNETSTTLDGSLTVGLGRIVAHNMAQGWDYCYTGEAAVGLFNNQGECLHVFNSPYGILEWTNYYNGYYLNSADNNPWKLNMSEVKDQLKNGRYYLRPMCHRLLNKDTDEWEGWRYLLNGNTIGVTVANNTVTVDAPNNHAVLSVEGQPEVLTPAYVYSGNLAAFTINVKNTSTIDARAEVKLTLKGTGSLAGETYVVPTAYTAGVHLAKNRGVTPWILTFPTSYSTSESVGALKEGDYTPVIEVTYPDGDNYFEDDVTDFITTTFDLSDFKIHVYKSGYQGQVSISKFSLCDQDNKALEYKIIDPQEVRALNISIGTNVGVLRDNYITLPVRYRLKNLTDESKSYTTNSFNLTMPYGDSEIFTASRQQIPIDKLANNSTYEIHVEMLRDGAWVDYWNSYSNRRQFSISTTNPVRDAEGVVGGYAKAEYDKLKALYDTYATTPSADNLNALSTAISETPRIAAAPMQVYRLRNKYSDNSTLYLSATDSRLSGQNASDSRALLFSLVPGRKAGTWRIYSLNAKKYVGTLPAYGTEAPLTADINEAADYVINTSASTYTATLTAAEPTDATYNALHLGKRNRIEPWTTTDESAQWYIEQVNDEFAPVYAFHFVDGCDYQTTYLPYAFTVPQGVAAGTITDATAKAGLQIDYAYPAGSTVPALTPVLLKGTAAESYECALIKTDNDGVAPMKNLLHGSLTDATTTADGDNLYYKLCFDDDQKAYGFFWGAAQGTPFTTKAYKAFLALPRAQAEALQRNGFSLSGDVTGIGSVVAPTTDAPAALYDLQGRRLKQAPTRGVYITTGGKKVIR